MDQVGILAIGNELLLGQITNKNAAKISQKLLDYHLPVVCHLTVADSIPMIHRSLNQLFEVANIVFVSGGLGPTADDLTRKAVSSYFDKNLIYDETTYLKLEEVLTKLEVSITSNHKQQAYFPEGSQIVQNTVGTANGFYIHQNKKHLFSLPGPWPEIESCWEHFIDFKLKSDFLKKSDFVIKSFHILGMPESEVADKVSKIIEGTSLFAEYRIHLPYVEIRFQLEDKKHISDLESKIRKNFPTTLAYEDQNSLLSQFIDKLSDRKVLIIDQVSRGYIFQKINELEISSKIDFYLSHNLNVEINTSKYDLCFDLKEGEEGDWFVYVNEKQLPLKRLTKRRLSKRKRIQKNTELLFLAFLQSGI